MKFLLTLALLALTLVCAPSTFAQCDLSVDAGADLLVCSGTNSVRLNGFVPDGALSFEWSPSANLSNPNSLTPLVFLNDLPAFPATFTLAASGFDPNANLIDNGDFETGDLGANSTTEYILATDPSAPFGLLGAEGLYVIDDNSGDTHDNFSNCTDHTGGGQMMVVNGSATAGQEVWCQSVSVTGGTDYIFNAWAMEVVNDPNAAELQFSIDGALLGDVFDVDGGVCNWEPFNAEYTATATGSVRICIVNQNTATGGNDFALDDIYFGEVCLSTDEVTIDEVSVGALGPALVELDCEGEATIDASASTAAPAGFIFYNWSGPAGGILSGDGTPVVTVGTAGNYTLEVSYDDGVTACTDELTVTVITGDVPVAVVQQPPTVDCNNPTVQLDATGSSTGPQWEYTWTPGANGVILFGGNTLTPTVASGGVYLLEVLNTVTNCIEIEVVVVDEDLAPPFAGINPSAGIPCGAEGVTLDGSPSGAGPGISYAWETTDGTIVSGQSGLSPFVSAPGTYQLIVGRGTNGCTDTATITITRQINDLAVVLAAPDTLLCAPAAVTLDGNGSSSGPNIVYAWTTAAGTIDAGENSLTPIVSDTGTYVLTVRDTGTGCFTRDSVTVGENTTPPALSLLVPDTITCVRDSAVLVAETTDPQALNFIWTLPAGSLPAETGLDSLLVLSAGTFSLVVTDAATGCTATDTVEVAERTDLPVADAGQPVTFTCGIDTAALDGSGSSSGTDFAYAWTTLTGNIVSGAGTQVPVVNAVGEYFLVVTDTATGCAARDTVRTESDDQAPPVAISVAGDLDCNNNFRELDATASASGEGFVFAWTTADGNFAGGQNTLTPRIDAPGIYVLTVTDTVNQCATTREVTILDATAPPTVVTGGDFRLDCGRPQDTLSAAGSDFAAPLVFNWATPDGHFNGPDNVPNPTVDSAGTYVLTVTNPVTGCFAVDSVVVTQDFAPPAALVGAGGQIDCATAAVLLGDSSSDPTNVYAWTTADGNITSNTDTGQALAGASGTYVLLVTDPDNDCFATDSVTVTESLGVPTVTIAPPGEINCGTGSFTLDAEGSSSGAPFTINWTTEDGAISNGATTLSPAITAQGLYTLIITDTTNACADTAAVTVTGNVVFPVAEAGAPATVTCSNGEVQLDPEGSDSGPNFTYSWTTADGSFVGDGGGSMPEVDSAGVYYLTVRNEDNNCETRDSVVITQDFALPAAVAGPDAAITCDSTTVTVGGPDQPGLSYFWSSTGGSVSGPINQSAITVTGAGTYRVLVTDFGNGCRNTDAVTVRVDTVAPPLSMLPAGVINCRDEEAVIAGVTTAGLTYTWTTQDGVVTGSTTLATSMAGAAGTYRLEVLDPTNGCRRAAAVTVTQDTASPVLNLAPAAPLNCRDTLVELYPAGPGGANLSYEWTTTDGHFAGTANVANPAADSAGIYVVTVTDENNFCSATDSVRVVQDVQRPNTGIAGPRSLNCRDSVLRLVGSNTIFDGPSSINWATANGNILEQSGNGISLDQHGNYTFTLTDETNFCSRDVTVAITADLTPPVLELATLTDLGCFAQNFTLQLSASGQGNLNYEWTTTGGTIQSGGQTATPTVTGTGTYVVTVTDSENGCTATGRTQAEQNIPEAFTFLQRDPNCSITTGTISFDEVTGGQAPYTYSIDAGTTFRDSPVFQGLDPDNYVLVVRDANGCETEEAAQITTGPDFQLAADPGALIDFGDSYQIITRINFPFAEVDTIVWTPTIGLSCTDCLDPVATPPETQSYRVRVETRDGCVADGFFTIIVNEENPVYFPTAFSPNGDGINDNYVPFASDATVARIVSMAVHDRWGEQLYFGEDFAPGDEPAGWDGTLNGTPVNPQVLVYSVVVEFVNEEVRTFKGDFVLMR